MRLHRLRLRAWGPFPGEQEVDFERLGQGGLFLVHGATGSGKTSILDAVCFALYADVPGTRPRSSLRSDHAAGDAVPGVELEFTASGRRLRVRRSPEFERIKKRGAGTTRVPAKVCLDEWAGGGWVGRGTRLDEVALVVKDVIGMDLDQFATVVLLPQGQFAAFLSAAPEHRRQVLERLFDTGRFARVEEWLADRRRGIATRAGAAHDALATALVRVDDVVAEIDPAASASDPPITRPSAVATRRLGVELSLDDVAREVLDLAQRLAREASEALTGAELAAVQVSETESALYAGRAVLRDQEAARLARVELAAVAEAASWVAQGREQVAAAQRAASVVTHVETAERARRRLDQYRIAVDAAQSLLGGAAPAMADPDPAGRLVDALVGSSLLVDSASAAAAQYEHESRLAERHAIDLAAADLRLADAQERSTAQQDRLTQLLERREQDRLTAAQLAEQSARRRVLARAVTLLRQLDAAAAQAVSLREHVGRLRAESLTARERLVSLQERRIGGMAAELAAALRDGEPCSVCGSTRHPAPAARSSPAVNGAQVDLARAAADEAASSLGSTERELTRLHTTMSTHVAEVASLEPAAVEGLAPLDEVAQADLVAVDWTGHVALARARLAETEGRYADAVAADGAVVAATEAAAACEAALRGLGEELVQVRAHAERSATVHLEARRRAELAAASAREMGQRHADRCPCVQAGQAGQAGPVDARPGATADAVALIARHHGQTLARAQTWLQAVRDRVAAEVELSAAVLRQDEALSAHGFETVAQMRSAKLSPGEAAELTSALGEVETRRIRVEALLAQPQVREAEAVPAPDPAALEREHRVSTTALAEARVRHARLEYAGRALRLLHGDVARAVDQLGPMEAELGLVRQLAECVSGTSADNTMRMRLSSYVLAARLEEVVLLANERLSRLSDGRYALQHSDELASRGARSGLGLRILDSWTGVLRPTGSLSGGEAFMASLALALGLGDAVRAEAGGLDLQTLFVDEGFGTLDEESLEQVLGVLDSLRDGGRTVGIVSHVAELRIRIPDQLQVRKTPEGSTLSVHSDGAGRNAA